MALEAHLLQSLIKNLFIRPDPIRWKRLQLDLFLLHFLKLKFIVDLKFNLVCQFHLNLKSLHCFCFDDLALYSLKMIQLKVFFFDTSCFVTSSCSHCHLKIPTALISIQVFYSEFSGKIFREIFFPCRCWLCGLCLSKLLSRSNTYPQQHRYSVVSSIIYVNIAINNLCKYSNISITRFLFASATKWILLS